MYMDFETVSTLQYRNRSLFKQVEDFKSGEKYMQMEAEYKKLLRFHHQEMKRIENELSKAHMNADVPSERKRKPVPKFNAVAPADCYAQIWRGCEK